MKQAETPFKHFAKHIGKYNLGDANLSINYKQAYAEALDEKFPLNPMKQTLRAKLIKKSHK